jgi:hypothetical protein
LPETVGNLRSFRLNIDAIVMFNGELEGPEADTYFDTVDLDENFVSVLDAFWDFARTSEEGVVVLCRAGDQIDPHPTREVSTIDPYDPSMVFSRDVARYLAVGDAEALVDGVASLRGQHFSDLRKPPVLAFDAAGRWAITEFANGFLYICGEPALIAGLEDTMGGPDTVRRRTVFSILHAFDRDCAEPFFDRIHTEYRDALALAGERWPIAPIIDNPMPWRPERVMRIDYPDESDEDPGHDPFNDGLDDDMLFTHVERKPYFEIDQNPPRKIIKFRPGLPYMKPSDYEWQAFRSWD